MARRGAATGGLDERWLLYLATTGSRITMPLINKNNTGGVGEKKVSYTTIIIKATLHQPLTYLDPSLYNESLVLSINTGRT